jgi:HK97 family phage prohead protease
MTEPIEPGGSNPAPANPHDDDGPTTAISMTAARALAAPATVDRAARTVEVVWSTGARARNFVPPLGMITEELDMSPGAVRMDGLRSGSAPVLNTHRKADARDVVGRVVAARLEAGRGYATLQFSNATDVEPLWQRVADGTLRSVSVGYRVHRYETVTDPRDGTVHRAVDWEPYEISVVPIPVDPAAAVRGAESKTSPVTAVEPALPGPSTPTDPTIPTNTQEPPMPETTPAIPASDPAPPAPAAVSASSTPAQTAQEGAPTMPSNIPIAPAAVPSAAAIAAPPAVANADRGAPAVPPGDAAAEVIRAERARIAALGPVAQAGRALVAPATVDALHQRAVAEGWAPEAFRGALWDAMVQGATPPALPASPNSGPAAEDPAVIRDAMAEAIAVRAMPGYKVPGGAAGGRHAEFLGWRPSEMVAELMRARGERNIPRGAAALADRAFHTTSDFPLLLSAAANKMLLAAYQPANPTYRQFFLRRDFRDFKPHRHLRVGDFPTLVQLSENGEIQAGTMSESQELVNLLTFARRIRVTRQMLVNDDLGAFTDFAAMIGRRVADFENATAYALMNTANGSGPTLVTGNAAVFATGAARANQASAGTALDLTNLAAGRAAVMKQKTLDGLPISVGNGMRLLVGPNLELAARQLTVSVAATQTANANVYAGFIQPVVEPQIQGNRWYLFADPLAAPVYVYGYLNGAEGPQVTTGPVSGVDGVEVSVIFDFGVGAIDWRGAWFNPGT